MNFHDAYAAGEPVKVVMPNGSEVLVVGYVEFEDRVGWMADGYLDPFPQSRPPNHFIKGTPEAKGDTVEIGGFVFQPAESGDWVEPYWHRLFESREPWAVQFETEELLRREWVRNKGWELIYATRQASPKP